MQWDRVPVKIPAWQLQALMLDGAFRHTLEEIIQFFIANVQLIDKHLMIWGTFKAYIRGVCVKNADVIRNALHDQLKELENSMIALEHNISS